MNILITGTTGQIGGALVRMQWPKDVTILAPHRDICDLEKPVQIRSFLTTHSIDYIIHCAAYTAVDRAEEELNQAFAINADATSLIAHHCKNAHIPLIYISTDYVFDGSSAIPYVEDDIIHPINIYGQSKAQGETAVRLNPHHYIIRTSWVVSAHGHNFLKTMLRLAKTQTEINVVADQYGAPTSADDIAQFIKYIVLRDQTKEPKYGTYHYANSGITNWAGVAEYIFACARELGHPAAHVRHIPTSDYPTRAARPAYSVLNTDKVKDSFGISIRSWQDALKDIITHVCAQS
jgi:dTDP-4-dehydrorhamnose reductase